MPQNPSQPFSVDGLDRWAGTAIVVLGLVLIFLITTLDTAATVKRQADAAGPSTPATSPEYAAMSKTAAQLLAAGNMDRLKPLLDELIAKSPYQAEPFMLLADYHVRRQEPVAAMHAFRQALDLNLDYLEKKNPRYQGKKIRNTVREAEDAINIALAENPADPAMRENRRAVYYMLRKLAGGCGD